MYQGLSDYKSQKAWQAGSNYSRAINPSENAPEGYKWVPGDGMGEEGRYEKVPFQGQEGVPYPNVSRGNDKYASKTRANIARSQWEDYKQRFQEYEDKLVGMAYTGPEGGTLPGAPANESGELYRTRHKPDGGMVGQATRQAEDQFGQGLDIASRQRERYGLSGAPSQQQQQQNELARGLSVVGARNNARDAWEKQRLGIMTGTSGGPASTGGR